MLLKSFVPVLSTLASIGEAAPSLIRFRTAEQGQTGGNATGLHSVLPDGDIHDSSWPDWTNETTRWSTFSAPTFDYVFIPEDEHEVSVGLEYFSGHNFSYFAQGGGHGYSATLGLIQNSVLVKLERFNHIVFNEDNSMTVGGGVRYRDLVNALYDHGREITVGSCVCVGSTGAMIGGGHGRLQGKHGLTSDALQKVRMVLWDGSIADASETENSDLFWAVRGAGQNFGVILESTYETYPLENDGNHYNADMVFSGDSLESVFSVVNTLIPHQDPALAMDLLFFADPSTLETILYLNLVYAGPESQGRKFANLFTTSNGTSKGFPTHITRLSINETVTPWSELNDVATGGAITAACATGSRQNTYTTNLKTFDVPTMRKLYDSFGVFVKKNPLAAGSLVLFEVFGQKGVTDQPLDSTAYANRRFDNVLALVEMIYTDDSVAKASDDYARGWRDVLATPSISGYSKQYVYQNYAHGDEPLGAIYGYENWRKEKLIAAKKKYDPMDYFFGYHNIPVDGTW